MTCARVLTRNLTSRKVIGSLGHWVIGSLGHWVIGSLGHWVIGSLGHWVIGSLGHWVIGSLGHWVIGSLKTKRDKAVLYPVSFLIYEGLISNPQFNYTTTSVYTHR